MTSITLVIFIISIIELIIILLYKRRIKKLKITLNSVSNINEKLIIEISNQEQYINNIYQEIKTLQNKNINLEKMNKEQYRLISKLEGDSLPYEK